MGHYRKRGIIGGMPELSSVELVIKNEGKGLSAGVSTSDPSERISEGKLYLQKFLEIFIEAKNLSIEEPKMSLHFLFSKSEFRLSNNIPEMILGTNWIKFNK